MNVHTGIGASILRKEDRRFITGKGNYVADIKRPDMAMGVFLRSPHAHALIKSIDIKAAAALPGVAAIFTGADLAADKVGGLPCALGRQQRRRHADEGAAAFGDGGRQGAMRRRRGGVRDRRHDRTGARSRGRDRGRLRGAAGRRRRARRDTPRRRRRVRRHPRQHLLRLGVRRRQGDGGGIQECGSCRQDQPGEQSPGRQSDGAARGSGGIRCRPRPLHDVDHQSVSACGEGADGQLRAEHPAAQIAHRGARRRRRLWRQAVPVRRGSHHHLGLAQGGSSGEMGQRTQRGLPVGRPWARSCQRSGTGARRNRQVPRPEGSHHRQHGRLPVDIRSRTSRQTSTDCCWPVSTPRLRSIARSKACSPTPCRSTPIAVPAVPRRPSCWNVSSTSRPAR